MKKITLSITLAAVSLFAGETEITSCMSCHGDFFEKSAMGYSRVVRDMSKEEIRTSLNGYLNDTYGGDKKFLMKLQLKRFDNIDSVVNKVYKVIDPESEDTSVSGMVEGDKIEIINTQEPAYNTSVYPKIESKESIKSSYPSDSEIIQKVNLDKNTSNIGLTVGDPIVTKNNVEEKVYEDRKPAPTIKVLDAEKVQYKTVREETGNTFMIERVK